jgi:hypothetical protein
MSVLARHIVLNWHPQEKQIALEVARILKIWQYLFWDGIPLDQAFIHSSADEKW